jgi:hypothetical protein
MFILLVLNLKNTNLPAPAICLVSTTLLFNLLSLNALFAKEMLLALAVFVSMPLTTTFFVS